MQQRGDDDARGHLGGEATELAQFAAFLRGGGLARLEILGLRFQVVGDILLATDLPGPGRIFTADLQRQRAGEQSPFGAVAADREMQGVREVAGRPQTAGDLGGEAELQPAGLRPVAAVAALDEPGRGREAYLGHHDRR